MMDEISSYDMGWVVGFLEGEGSFAIQNNSLSATQKQKQPLEELQMILGCGTIRPFCKDYWRYVVSSNNAINIMKKIYPMMSPRRREQIKPILEEWDKTSHTIIGSSICKNGHNKNITGRSPGNRCKVCCRRSQREYAQRRRDGNHSNST